MANGELEHDIVSSTGALGLARRPDDRLYCNWRSVVSDASFIDRQFRRAVGAIDCGYASRCVLRAILTRDALAGIADTRAACAVEAAVPAGTLDGQPIWMTLFGINSQGRRPTVSVEDMVESTTTYVLPRMLPQERIQSVEQAGFCCIAQILPGEVDEILTLWEPTFGWTREGVEALAQRLISQQLLEPSRRDVWFSGVADPRGQIVSVSMAELLRLPLGHGDYLPIVESTEWRTRAGHEGHGLMAAGVSFLHTQILRDLAQLPRSPLIIAETNFRTRADRVGNAVGMHIPPRLVGETNIPQILAQNVVVGDGRDPEGLRDFTMMYLPLNNQEEGV